MFTRQQHGLVSDHKLGARIHAGAFLEKGCMEGVGSGGTDPMLVALLLGLTTSVLTASGSS